MTQYEVFLKYSSSTNGRFLTNKTKTKWNVATTNQWSSAASRVCGKITEDMASIDEVFIISSQNATNNNNSNAFTYISENSVVKNPKYDMLFIYDGLGHITESSYPEPVEIYYDRMKRVNAEPWIPLFTTSSLKAALEKAKVLIDEYGEKNIKIGKSVPLDISIKMV